jgi:hypothetical protein
MSGFDYTELDPEERTNKYMALISIALGVISLACALKAAPWQGSGLLFPFLGC